MYLAVVRWKVAIAGAPYFAMAVSDHRRHHIRDSRIRLRDAYAMLFRRFDLLWRIGARDRARGFKAESICRLIADWRREKALIDIYPSTE